MVAIAALDTIPGFSSSATSTPCSCSRGHDHPTRDNDCSNIDDYPFNVFLQPDHYWEAGFEVNMPCFDVDNEPIYETDDEFDDFNENLDDHC